MPRRVLVIGGGFAGLCVARDLADHFHVTLIDAKEFFEYTPGILRAYVKPKHLDALTFCLHPVVEGRMGAKFIWGEVLKVDGPNRTCTYKPMFQAAEETIDFDYCVCANGCNFGVFHQWGESLWFPTVHQQARLEGSWPHIDERFLEGRRRHIFQEYNAIIELEKKCAEVLVVGAGFIGVEWVTELQHFFPHLKLRICDMLPRCLGPLPEKAAEYCSKYMNSVGIKTYYKKKFASGSKEFYDSIELPGGPAKEFICVGIKASNYFVPKSALSNQGTQKGPKGWIMIDDTLAITLSNDEEEYSMEKRHRWSEDDKKFPRIFAIGDCNYGCIQEADKPKEQWRVPPIPKISYPGEEEAVIVSSSIYKIDRAYYEKKDTDCLGNKIPIVNLMHWPWGAGMFATSLGPDNACFVAGANWNWGSGWMVLWGQLSAVQKEIIEASKVNECRMGYIGRLIWHFVHHTPMHLWGRGPLWGY